MAEQFNRNEKQHPSDTENRNETTEREANGGFFSGFARGFRSAVSDNDSVIDDGSEQKKNMEEPPMLEGIPAENEGGIDDGDFQALVNAIDSLMSDEENGAPKRQKNADPWDGVSFSELSKRQKAQELDIPEEVEPSTVAEEKMTVTFDEEKSEERAARLAENGEVFSVIRDETSEPIPLVEQTELDEQSVLSALLSALEINSEDGSGGVVQAIPSEAEPAYENDPLYEEDDGFAQTKREAREKPKSYGVSKAATDTEWSPAVLLHVVSTVHSRMIDTMLAFLPILVWAVYLYGSRVLTVTVLCVVSCVMTEWWTRLLFRLPVTLQDGSAVVSGLILACLLPAGCSFWMPLLGGAVAMLVKAAFGGLGKNLVNPALTGFLVSAIVFRDTMSVFPKIGQPLSLLSTTYYAGDNPMTDLLSGNLPAVSLSDAWIGNYSGMLGTVSALCIALGAVVLLCRRVISYRIPLAYLASFSLLTLFISPNGETLTYALYMVACSGVLFGAFFLCGDSVTTPVTENGKWCFGLACGVLHYLLNRFQVPYAMMITVWTVGLSARPLDLLFRYLHRIGKKKQNPPDSEAVEQAIEN